MKRSTVLQTAAGVVIAAAGVWVFLRQVDIAGMVDEVRRMAWWKIAAVGALNVGTLFFRSLRWSVLLPERDSSSKKGLFPLVMIGFMVNNIIPARAGEVVRAALLWKRNRFTVAESAGSILIERLLDILVFVLFLIVPILLIPRLSSFRIEAWLLAGGVCATLLCFLAYGKNRALVTRIAGKSLGVLPAKFHKPVIRIAVEIFSNLDWLFSARRCASVATLSFLTLACQVGMLWVLGREGDGFGVLVSMFGIACAAVGAAIPLSPGYVGTLHAVMSGGLVSAGIAKETAAAIAVLYHAIGYITITSIGIYYFFRLKVSMKEIREGRAANVDVMPDQE